MRPTVRLRIPVRILRRGVRLARQVHPASLRRERRRLGAAQLDDRRVGRVRQLRQLVPVEAVLCTMLFYLFLNQPVAPSGLLSRN